MKMTHDFRELLFRGSEFTDDRFEDAVLLLKSKLSLSLWQKSKKQTFLTEEDTKEF